MKVNATQKAAFVIAATLMATLPFQNCGKSVQFSSVASENGKTASFYTDVDDNLVSLPPDTTQPTTPSDSDDSGAGPITRPPAPDIADNTDEPGTSEPPTTQLPSDPPANNGGGSSSDQADNQPGASQPGTSQPDPSSDDQDDPDDQIVRNDDQDDASEDLDDESDGDLNLDHDGKHIGSRCRSGAKDALVDVAALASADDIVLDGISSQKSLLIPAARHFTLLNFSGKRIGVKAALEVLDASNISGHAMVLRADKIDKVGVSSISLKHLRLMAREMGNISNVSGGHLCASARSFGEISNLSLSGGDHHDHNKCHHKGHHHGAVSKIVGRFDVNGLAPMGRVSNLSGGAFLFARVKSPSIKNVSGRLILRDVEIDEISDASGEIVLIHSKVKKLKNFSGKLVLKDSQLLSQENVSGEKKVK